ncbi:MAG: MBL fold metallo-hydrolase [Desulfarculus sp.]|nr:MBL fold metallo-hydrolase [Desulfarculus sp.]
MKIVQIMVGQMAVYAYLVACEQTGQALVIDPAGNEERIAQEATGQGFSIVGIVNTHGHPDHTCGNARLKELTGAPILVHEKDAGPMVSREALSFAAMLGCAGTPPADRTFTHGEVLKAGQEVALQVIHTPGHTPGSVCLYTPGHVFTGDTLFVGAVGRTDLPGGSWPQMLKSIEERILTLPAETVVWPGHDYGESPQSTVGQEREHNPFLR